MIKTLLSSCAASVLLTSCGAIDTVKSTTAKVTAKANESISKLSLPDLRPSKIDVVEVREKELKEMPLGKDRALAYERKKSFWSFIPATFKEPDLPKIEESEFDGGLLPPKPL